MVKVKTSDLTGRALDWAVAETDGGKRIFTTRKEFGLNVAKKIIPPYSSSWAYCGPLIERHSVGFSELPVTYEATVETNFMKCISHGETPLIAICRAVVASKFGDEVDIPDELTN
ncbi:phage protein NinX family protein [Citrobacter freundii]